MSDISFQILTKEEIVESLNKSLSPDTVLCSDGRVNYKDYVRMTTTWSMSYEGRKWRMVIHPTPNRQKRAND